MPELDSTSDYAHLVQLAREYKKTIERTEDPSFTMDELQILLSERTVLHDQIIAELVRLGRPVENREDAMKFALRIANWISPLEDDYDV